MILGRIAAGSGWPPNWALTLLTLVIAVGYTGVEQTTSRSNQHFRPGRVTWLSTPSGPCSHRLLYGALRGRNVDGRGLVGSNCEHCQGVVAGNKLVTV
jgi:hypothetical protein